MIEIPLSTLRQFRAVCRRARRGHVVTQGWEAWVAFRSGSKGVDLGARADRVWMAYRHPGRFPNEEFILPLEAMADFEGKGDAVVTFKRTESGKIQVQWMSGGIPQIKEYETCKDVSAFPELPSTMKTNGSELLDALSEATATADKGRVRYALDCLELRGTGRDRRDRWQAAFGQQPV